MSRRDSILWRPSAAMGRLTVRTLLWGGLMLGTIAFLAWVRWPPRITVAILLVTTAVCLYKLLRALIDGMAGWSTELEAQGDDQPRG